MELKPITIHELLAENVRRFPDKTAVIFQEKRYRWKDLELLTDALALDYLQMGIGKGTHVGVFGANSAAWVCTFLALAKIGAISVLINFNMTVQELSSIIDYAQLEVLCYGKGHQEADLSGMMEEQHRKNAGKCKTFIAIEELQVLEEPMLLELTLQEKEKLMQLKLQVDSSHPLSMIFTSGTTADPKGVILTQFQMLNVACAAVEAMRWTDKDRICLALALFHCFGLSTGLLSSLVTGCQLGILSNFRSQNVLGMVEKEHCTVLNGVPSMFLAMMNNPQFAEYDLSSLCSGIIAGSGIRSQDYFRIKKAFGYPCLQQSYGQTEASPSITFSDYNDDVKLKAVSVGRVIPHVCLRVVDRKTGNILPEKKAGEIQIHGFNIMQQGYFRMPEETKKAFTADGWLRTGDLGYLDEQGNLYITGRIKDVIIRCGENISPKEVEDVILEYPQVKDVVVFGQEDPVVQEEVAACIVCGEDYREEELLKHLNSRLARYKVPKFIYPFREFPMNSNGKIDKKSLLLAAGKMKKIKEEA